MLKFCSLSDVPSADVIRLRLHSGRETLCWILLLTGQHGINFRPDHFLSLALQPIRFVIVNESNVLYLPVGRGHGAEGLFHEILPLSDGLRSRRAAA
jgi:hypothetical protein